MIFGKFIHKFTEKKNVADSRSDIASSCLICQNNLNSLCIIVVAKGVKSVNINPVSFGP